jgi:hypothetical protein
MEIAAREYTYIENQDRVESVTDNNGDCWKVVGIGNNVHEFLVENSNGRAGVFYLDRMSILPISEGAIYAQDHLVREGKWSEHRAL